MQAASYSDTGIAITDAKESVDDSNENAADTNRPRNEQKRKDTHAFFLPAADVFRIEQDVSQHQLVGTRVGLPQNHGEEEAPPQ